MIGHSTDFSTASYYYLWDQIFLHFTEIQKIQYGNSREEEPARQSGPRPYISPREVKTEDGGEVVKLTEKVYLPVEKYPKVCYFVHLLPLQVLAD